MEPLPASSTAAAATRPEGSAVQSTGYRLEGSMQIVQDVFPSPFLGAFCSPCCRSASDTYRDLIPILERQVSASVTREDQTMGSYEPQVYYHSTMATKSWQLILLSAVLS